MASTPTCRGAVESNVTICDIINGCEHFNTPSDQSGPCLPLYHPERGHRYERVQRLGAGAFGEVSLVRDLTTGSLLASKSIQFNSGSSSGGGGYGGGGYGRFGGGRSPSPLVSKPLFRELQALQRLQGSPNIVTLHDVYPLDTKLVLIFEYAPSYLEMVIDAARAPIAERHVSAWAQMLLQGLAHMHAQGIIHRDIKPGKASHFYSSLRIHS